MPKSYDPTSSLSDRLLNDLEESKATEHLCVLCDQPRLAPEWLCGLHLVETLRAEKALIQALVSERNRVQRQINEYIEAYQKKQMLLYTTLYSYVKSRFIKHSSDLWRFGPGVSVDDSNARFWEQVLSHLDRYLVAENKEKKRIKNV